MQSDSNQVGNIVFRVWCRQHRRVKVRRKRHTHSHIESIKHTNRIRRVPIESGMKRSLKPLWNDQQIFTVFCSESPRSTKWSSKSAYLERFFITFVILLLCAGCLNAERQKQINSTKSIFDVWLSVYMCTKCLYGCFSRHWIENWSNTAVRSFLKPCYVKLSCVIRFGCSDFSAVLIVDTWDFSTSFRSMIFVMCTLHTLRIYVNLLRFSFCIAVNILCRWEFFFSRTECCTIR